MKDVDCNSLWNIATKVLLGFLGLGVISIPPGLAQSNITPDNTLGTEASQVTPNVNNSDGIPSELIEAGAQRSQNLFHSFQEFNVSEGRAAYFLVPNDTIQNVLTRVTGNNPSEILGTLGTTSNRNFTPTDANLFLINPNGIVFGRNASLDVNGSFVGTTANIIGFGERGAFSATSPQAPSGLLTVAPSALLFNQINAQASIQNNSVADAGLNPGSEFTAEGLRVPDGKSLLLVGGDINMDGGGLSAFGGRVELGGLAGAGTVGLNEDGNNLSLSFPDSVERSDVSLSNGASVTVIAGDGGSITVNARNLQMTGGSNLFAGIESGLGSDNSQAGNIEINATEAINLNNESLIDNRVEPEARGKGGQINIKTRSLSVSGGATLVAHTFGQGNAGSVTISATDAVSVDGVSTGIGSQVFEQAVGDGGSINITTGTLSASGGATLVANTYGQGNAGDVTISATDAVSLEGVGIGTQVTGIGSQVLAGAVGNGGKIEITARSLAVTNGARIIASTSGQGNGGNVDLVVRDTVSFDGVGSNGKSSGAFSSVEVGGMGEGGDINLMTDTLSVANGAILDAQTQTSFKAGDIIVNATQSINLNQASLLAQSTDKSPSAGAAGEITINARQLIARNGTLTTSSEQSSGGGITITVDKIRLFGNSDITTNVNQSASEGGNIYLKADSILAFDDSDILAYAQDGKGGNITLNTPAFFGQNYKPARADTDPSTLDGNNRVDINASGRVSGVITLPDTSFIQNSLLELPENPIDTAALVASSCVVRSNERNGTFLITGKTGLPYRPGDAVASVYSAVDVQPVPDHTSAIKPAHRWKIGDPIVEPTGVYRLENGQLLLSRKCGK